MPTQENEHFQRLATKSDLANISFELQSIPSQGRVAN